MEEITGGTREEMKFTYPTELEWIMQREEAIEKGFIVRNGVRYEPLFLDTDQVLSGYDLFLVDKQEIAVVKWQRTEIASQVTEEMTTKKIEEAEHGLQQFSAWLQEYRYKDDEDEERTWEGV